MESGGQESVSLFQVLLKLMLTQGKDTTRWFPPNNQRVGQGMGGSQARWGWSLSQSVVNMKCSIFLWVPKFP
jgi:hypothetical protein